MYTSVNRWHYHIIHAQYLISFRNMGILQILNAYIIVIYLPNVHKLLLENHWFLGCFITFKNLNQFFPFFL